MIYEASEGLTMNQDQLRLSQVPSNEEFCDVVSVDLLGGSGFEDLRS